MCEVYFLVLGGEFFSAFRGNNNSLKMFPLIAEPHFLESMQLWNGSMSSHDTCREESPTAFLSLLFHPSVCTVSGPALTQAPAGKVGIGIPKASKETRVPIYPGLRRQASEDTTH